MLDQASNLSLDQVGLDYLVEVISQKIHDVFALFRNPDNLVSSKKEFLKLAMKAAEFNPTTIIQNRNSVLASTIKDQHIMNFFITPNAVPPAAEHHNQPGGGRAPRGGRNIRGSREIRGGRGGVRGNQQLEAEVPGKLIFCFDYVSNLLGVRRSVS